MSKTRTGTLKVPGATLYHEVSGSGPNLLLVPGGAEDAGTFSAVRAALSKEYRVISWDPRGLSRSPFDGEPQDVTVGDFAEDAHLLLRDLGAAPAFVFGTSSGALVGFELALRHPDDVRALIAHEPPVTQLLDDADEHAAVAHEVYDIYRKQGVGPAMAKFLEDSDQDQGEGEAEPPGDPSADEAAAMERMQVNLDFFLGHMWLPLLDYMPDLGALRSFPVTVAVGEDSAGQLAYRASVAVAEKLGHSPESVPGDHAGFSKFPDAFADRVKSVFEKA